MGSPYRVCAIDGALKAKTPAFARRVDDEPRRVQGAPRHGRGDGVERSNWA
jgi:hypothetical protein